MEPTKVPCCQLKDWYTSGAVFARLPPKTIADSGTPVGLLNSEDRHGQFVAFAVNREFGCAPQVDLSFLLYLV